jgi:flagellar assembly protein FliH
LEQLISERVAEQVLSLKADAEAAGRQEGETAGRLAYEQAAERMEGLAVSLAEGLERNAALLEQQLVELAVAIAREIVGRELEDDRSYAVTLAEEALGLLGEAEETEIAVSPPDAPVLTERIEHLSATAPGVGRLRVRVDPEISAGCRVETRLASVDASVEARLRNVRDALKRGAAS